MVLVVHGVIPPVSQCYPHIVCLKKTHRVSGWQILGDEWTRPAIAAPLQLLVGALHGPVPLEVVLRQGIQMPTSKLTSTNVCAWEDHRNMGIDGL